MRALIAALAFATFTVPAASAADITAGKKVFNRCKACHAVGAGARNKVGPQLNGIVGRAAGTVDGYKYGKGLVALAEGGHVWTEENIPLYVVDPAGYVEEVLGSRMQAKMPKQRVKKEQFPDLLAYLASFDADGNQTR